MIRVGQIIQDIDSEHGGTSSAFVEIVSAVASQAPRATVLAYTARPADSDPILAKVSPASGAEWRLTGRAGGFFPGRLAEAVVADINSGRLDVLQIHGVWCSDLVSAANACRRKGVPCFWTPHGMLMAHALHAKRWKKELFLRMGLRRALRASAGVLFATTGEMRSSLLPEGVASQRVIGLPVPVGLGESELPRLKLEGRRRFGLSDEAEVISFIGRLHPVKRLELSIEAFAVAHRSRPRAVMLVLGDGEAGYVQSLRDLADCLGIAENVVFGGWVAGDDKWRALACADVALINSVHENFGYGVVEPMAVGTPVVLTRNLSMSEDVLAAGVGSVAEETPAALGNALITLLASPSRKELGLKARRWVEESFSPPSVGRRLVSVYEASLDPSIRL